MALWGSELTKYCDGRKPPEIWTKKHIIPCNQLCPCWQVLKMTPFKLFLSELKKPITVYLGFGWSDYNRLDAPRRNYESIPGVRVDHPLLWDYPFDLRKEIESWGIRIPRFYNYGFSHNNCGGRCPKQGQLEWLRLLRFFPERFEEMERWEQEARSHDDSRSNRSFLKRIRDGRVSPLTLRQLRLESSHNPALVGLPRGPEQLSRPPGW